MSEPNQARETTGRVGPRKVAEILALQGDIKEGKIDGFTLTSDEAARAGGHGTGSAPSPLAYFTAGMGF